MGHVEKCLQRLAKKPMKLHGENQWSPWAAWQEVQGNMSSHGRPNGISRENKLHCKVQKARDKWEASLKSYRNSPKSFLAFKNATLTYSYISKHSLWNCSIKLYSTPTLPGAFWRKARKKVLTGIALVCNQTPVTCTPLYLTRQLTHFKTLSQA